MDVAQYHQRKAELQQAVVPFRELCVTCLQPTFGCYCAHIQTFDPQIKFVILIHPIEVKRRIATGRMSHLCLQNSELIAGQDYSAHSRVNEILRESQQTPLVLYPGPQSLNLTRASADEKMQLLGQARPPVIFVIDGTWATAKKMIRQSRNLAALPRICFDPPGPSNFRVRKQPAPECYSTLEAIHHTIELLAPAVGLSMEARIHDRLTHVFDQMVEKQLGFIRASIAKPNALRYRRQNLPD